MPQLTLEEIGALRVLLGRTQLSGQEVAGFVQLANKLTDIEQYLATKKAPRGAKNVPTAGQ